MGLKQLTKKEMIRDNSNLNDFGLRSKKIDMEQNKNEKVEKIKIKEGDSRCQNSIKNYMEVSVKNDAKNYDISPENDREIQNGKVLQRSYEDARSQDPVTLMKYLIKKNKKYVERKQKEASTNKKSQDEKALKNHCIMEERDNQDEEKLGKIQISADTNQKNRVPIREIGIKFSEFRNSDQKIIQNSNNSKDKVKNNDNINNKVINAPNENTKINLSKPIRENDPGINTLIIPPSINLEINTLIIIVVKSYWLKRKLMIMLVIRIILLTW